MAPGGRKSDRVNSNPFAAPRPGGKSTNKARLDYLMPGTINANTVRKLGTQDGTDSSELSGGVSNVNANMIQMPAVQDGINMSGSGGKSTKARLDFGVHDTQGRTTSSGPVSKRSNTDVNPIHTPTTQNTSIGPGPGPGGKRSTTDANPILMPVTQNKNTSAGVRGSTINSGPSTMPHMNDRATSFGPGPGGKRSSTDANPILMPVTQDKNPSTGSGARRSTISSSSFLMPHSMNDRATSFGPGPGGKRSSTDANPIVMPITHDKTPNTGSGVRRSNISSSPFPMPHMNDKIASFGPGPGGKRSFTDANPNLVPLTQGKNTCTGSGVRRSNISPFPMPHSNDRETSFGKRSKTDADTTLKPATHDKNTSAGGRGSHVNTNHVSDEGISTNNNNSFSMPNTQNSFSMPNTQDGATTSGTKKKVRQKSTNKKLTEHLRLGGKRPRIEIHDDLTVPLGPWAASWSTEIGITVRKHVPLRFRTWAEVKKEKGLFPLFQQLLKSFDVDFSKSHVVIAVDAHLKKLYKDYRHELHMAYLDLPDEVDKTEYPPDEVTQEDWKFLCAYWETDAYKKRSAANKKSRTNLDVLHRGGSKTFVRHRYEMTNPETNELPDAISHYKSMHHNLEKGWVAPRAEENYDKMVEMSTQPTEEGDEPPTADEVREKVLGKRPGYACGLGYGVAVPTRATAAAAAVAAVAAAAATAAARADLDLLTERAEAAENELRVIKEQQEIQHREQMEQQRRQMEQDRRQMEQQRQLDMIMAQLSGSSTPLAWYDLIFSYYMYIMLTYCCFIFPKLTNVFFICADGIKNTYTFLKYFGSACFFILQLWYDKQFSCAHCTLCFNYKLLGFFVGIISIVEDR